ncbi:hypothetical protein [uncultured Limosilactobacillus sp.]|uniref:hypothetical protein n=1 Tax=uncultured Limosilactobacillus sp. TaxID=2837629 RepID=UPI0025FD20A4|nr:hypothetical protein [uncultured Limosilactobacillus sp.]
MSANLYNLFTNNSDPCGSFPLFTFGGIGLLALAFLGLIAGSLMLPTDVDDKRWYKNKKLSLISVSIGIVCGALLVFALAFVLHLNSKIYSFASDTNLNNRYFKMERLPVDSYYHIPNQDNNNGTYCLKLKNGKLLYFSHDLNGDKRIVKRTVIGNKQYQGKTRIEYLTSTKRKAYKNYHLRKQERLVVIKYVAPKKNVN